MKKRFSKGSVRWRLVLIYFMLVFIAMAIVSVYLISGIENYQLTSLKQNIENSISETGLMSTLAMYDDLVSAEKGVQDVLLASFEKGTGQEYSVVSDNETIVASTNQMIQGKSAVDVFDTELLAGGLSGNRVERTSSSGDIDLLSISVPVIRESDEAISGALIVRVDLTSINQLIAQSRVICIRAIVLALVITIVLGFFIARSITDPINDVTKTVQQMSLGDFSKEVSVKSDDEIGQLARMFNILRAKLDATLEEISNEKNKLGTILEYMADGLVAIDLNGNVLHANPRAKEILLLPQGEDYPNNYDYVLGHIAKELPLESLKENCKEEGAEGIYSFNNLICALRYDRFRDEDGNDIGIIIIIQDITERQKLEDMQTDFVANVSHELKTPLTNIKSYTETLMDGAIEDPQMSDHFLQIIDSEADRMNRLVKDLLQLSRLDNNQEILAPKETNAIVLIDTAVTKVELVAKDKHQMLNRLYDIDADIRINVDRDRFEQVILNLLSNAIKYTDEGGRIDVDVYEEGPVARIVVQDNGIGIGSEALPRIFERFYRVDKARSRAMGGTGLGLAITKQIVEGHGGTITAESQEGKGTRMIIEMPLANRKGIRNIE